jgi:hypothetical protein
MGLPDTHCPGLTITHLTCGGVHVLVSPLRTLLYSTSCLGCKGGSARARVFVCMDVHACVWVWINVGVQCLRSLIEVCLHLHGHVCMSVCAAVHSR